MALFLTILSLFAIHFTAVPAAASKLTDARAAIEHGDFTTGIRLLTELAHEGNAEAQHNLAIANEYGFGIPQNLERAVEWYKRAAAQGHAGAQTNLGLAYASGRGIKRDDQAAEYWWRKAAAQGSVLAAYNLGETLKQADDETAVKYAEQAARAGFAPAMCLLGSIYRTGLKNLQKNPHRSFSWSEKGAQLNELPCIYQAGLAYYEGFGTKKDYQEAYYWLYRALIERDQDCRPCGQPEHLVVISDLEKILSKSEVDRAQKRATGGLQ
jgi:TPR repeat protein